MLTPTKRIEYTSGETIKIRPIYDVHLGTTYCDEKAFKADLAACDDSTYFFSGGDLLDSIIMGDPRYQKHMDATGSNEVIDEQVEKAYDILKPYKNRILGLGIGNHEKTMQDRHGTNPTKRLCKMLETELLGYSGLLRLQLRIKKDGGGGRSVVIRYHHGWGGGGRTAGGAITKYSKDLTYWDADVFLYGHDHQRDVKRIPRLGLAGARLISRPKILGICGTYLKTYSETADVPYGEQGGYPPVEIGGITIEIKPDAHAWAELKAYV